MSATPPDPTGDGLSTLVGRFMTAPFRAQTYKNLVYLALQFPLGVTYFTLLVPVLAFGLGTLPLLALFGLPLVGTLVLGIALMTVDRGVTELLLPVELDRHAATASLDDGVVAYVTELLLDPGTYLSLAFVLVKFVVGVATFVALTVSGSLVVAFVTAPLFYASPTTNYIFSLPSVSEVAVTDTGLVTGPVSSAGPSVVVDTLPEALGLAAAGLLLCLVSLNLLNATAWLLGRLTAFTCRHARVFSTTRAADDRSPADHA
ncbi:sensor domain-containing protein [Halogranum gelatinilyticum]|nr:sensor domain-containing protein [Halogranum gelatinilyticum]